MRVGRTRWGGQRWLLIAPLLAAIALFLVVNTPNRQAWGMRLDVADGTGTQSVASGSRTQTPSPVSSAPLPAVAADPNLEALYETTTLPNGESVPSVVARVSGSDITAAAFARMVALTRDQVTRRNLGWTEGHIWTAALNVLIQDAALYGRAVAEGVSVSDSELASYVAHERAALAAAAQADPTVMAKVNATVAAAGDSDYETFMQDPKVLAAYRRDLMKGKLITMHVGANGTVDAANNFIAQTIALAPLTVFISIPA